MEEDYKIKYLKYKKKYLDLKTSVGGASIGDRLTGMFKKSDVEIHREKIRDLLLKRLKEREEYLQSLVKGLDEKTRDSVLRFYRENFETGLLKLRDGKVFQEIKKLNNTTDNTEKILVQMFNTSDLDRVIRELVNRGITVVYEEVYVKNIISNNLTNSDYPKKTPNLSNLVELVSAVSYIDMCKDLGIKLNMQVCTAENVASKKQRIEKSNAMVKKLSDMLVDLNKDVLKAKDEINGSIIQVSKAIENRDKKLREYSSKAGLDKPVDSFEKLEQGLKKGLLSKKLVDSKLGAELGVDLLKLSGDLEKDKILLLNRLRERFISQVDVSNDKTIKLNL
jgi:hypothetical protein